MVDTTGEADLRAENVDSAVKGFALQSYVFKSSLMINSSSAWTETYFQETAADLSNASSPVKGVPRLANFPHAEVSWTEQSARNVKYGLEGTISWEDKLTNAVDVIARTLLRIGRGVAKAVDDEIYSQVSTNAGNTVTITAGNEWNSATLANRDPMDNLLEAIQVITEANYDVLANSGEVWLSPKDFRYLLNNPNVKNSGQFWTSDPTKKGTVGMIAGLITKVSNSVTADEAIVITPKISGTWKQVRSLTVKTIEDPMISFTIRASEIGVTQITNPDAIAKIANTQA